MGKLSEIERAYKQIEYLAQTLEITVKELEEMRGVVRRLAEWSRKYPVEQIYSLGIRNQMEDEIHAIEEAAKKLIPEATQPKQP